MTLCSTFRRERQPGWCCLVSEMLEFPKHFDGLHVLSSVLKMLGQRVAISSIMRCRQLDGLDRNVFLKISSPKDSWIRCYNPCVYLKLWKMKEAWAVCFFWNIPTKEPGTHRVQGFGLWAMLWAFDIALQKGCPDSRRPKEKYCYFRIRWG